VATVVSLIALIGAPAGSGPMSVSRASAACKEMQIGGTPFHGVAIWVNAPPHNGVWAKVLVQPATTYDNGIGGWVSQVLWEATNNGSNLHTSNSWVEVGWRKGWLGANQLVWYWADQRPGLGYYQHFLGGAPGYYPVVGHTYDVILVSNAPNTWTIYIDGVLTNARSYPNPGPARSAAVGLEFSNTCSQLEPTSSSSLIYRDTQWRSPWPPGGPTGAYHIGDITPPAYAAWCIPASCWADELNP
jgi:hypothetical protein